MAIWRVGTLHASVQLLGDDGGQWGFHSYGHFCCRPLLYAPLFLFLDPMACPHMYYKDVHGMPRSKRSTSQVENLKILTGVGG